MEAYRAYSDLEGMKELAEGVIKAAARAIGLEGMIDYQGQAIDLFSPWPSRPMTDVVSEVLGREVTIDTPVEELRAACDEHDIEYKPEWTAGKLIAELFDELGEAILINPTFVVDYPVEVSPPVSYTHLDVYKRQSHARVSIGGELVGSIRRGYLILLGVGHADTRETAEKLWGKIFALRINDDAEGKTNLALDDVAGEVLVVSQFTLFANCKKGRRPSFTEAAPPAQATELYAYFVSLARADVPHLSLIHICRRIGWRTCRTTSISSIEARWRRSSPSLPTAMWRVRGHWLMPWMQVMRRRCAPRLPRRRASRCGRHSSRTRVRRQMRVR